MRVGFVGWRGMVGSVLMERMRAENDFAGLESVFFSTSNPGGAAPKVAGGDPLLKDARDLAALASMDAIITCQGGDYTSAIHGPLRGRGWKGWWIDAASTLRMAPGSVIILDPVNRKVIERAIKEGKKDYIGGNCTVSLMLMALGGLFERDLIEWLSSMTYQAASGAGAENMTELMKQMAFLAGECQQVMADPAASALDMEKQATAALRGGHMPTEKFGAPLAASLIPWIDRAVEHGQTREEWKGSAETNKILGREDRPIPVDGLCVRVGSLRCHSQGFTLKLRKALPPAEVAEIVKGANPWVRLVENTKEATLAQLTPAAVSGKLEVPIGRLRPMLLGPEYYTAFSVGDQLLWGAAEPLRRMLGILRGG